MKYHINKNGNGNDKIISIKKKEYYVLNIDLFKESVMDLPANLDQPKILNQGIIIIFHSEQSKAFQSKKGLRLPPPDTCQSLA